MERLQTLVANTLGVASDAIVEDFSMKQCDLWDSLSHMALISAIEGEYQLNLPMEAIIKMTDFKGIKSVLQAQGISV